MLWPSGRAAAAVRVGPAAPHLGGRARRRWGACLHGAAARGRRGLLLITEGVAGTAMVPWKEIVPEREGWALVHYPRTLARDARRRDR